MAAGPVVDGAAQVVVGDVVLQRAQQHVAHGRRDRHDVQHAVVGRMSDSAVQPWNVRNAEHITVDGNSWTSVRWAPSHGS